MLKKCLLLPFAKISINYTFKKMKKFYTLIILLALVFSVKAQEGFSISPFVGVAGSGIKIKDDKANIQGYAGMKAGFEGGLKFQYEFATPFIIEFQTFYNRCGYSLTVPETGMNEYIDFTMDFISIPFLFGYSIYIGEKENFIISPKVGISPNIFVNTFAEYQDIKFDTKIDNKVDWRGMLELEFTWKVNNLLSIFLDVNGRAGWGLITYTNISEYIRDWKEPGIYNYVISGNLGLKFKITNREKDVYEFY